MRLSLDTRARRLLRRLPVITVYSALEILLLSLLALQCARLAWAVVTPVGPIGDWKIPAALGGPVAATLALGEFDPFFRTQNAAATAVVVTSLAVKLFGVRVDLAGGRDSAIMATPDGVQSSFGVGDEVMPGVRLAGVRDDGVVLERNGAREQLFLDQSVPAANATPASTSGGATGGFTPRLANGQVNGFTIGTPPAILANSGLQAGDTVVSINGAGVTSATDAQALAGGLVPGSSISLGIERAGTIVPLTVQVPR